VRTAAGRPAWTSDLHVDERTDATVSEVREVFAIYERGAPELRAIRRESDVHPRVAQDRDELEASLSTLVDTALGPLDATQQDRAVARAMVDLNTWEALGDQGLGPAESVAAVSDMLARRLTARRRRVAGRGEPAANGRLGSTTRRETR
jgi:hypothetical protein